MKSSKIKGRLKKVQIHAPISAIHAFNIRDNMVKSNAWRYWRIWSHKTQDISGKLKSTRSVKQTGNIWWARMEGNRSTQSTIKVNNLWAYWSRPWSQMKWRRHMIMGMKNNTGSDEAHLRMDIMKELFWIILKIKNIPKF